METLERCGYCGAFFRGTEYLTAEEVKTTDLTTLETAPLGYCPNAMQEHYEQNGSHEEGENRNL